MLSVQSSKSYLFAGYQLLSSPYDHPQKQPCNYRHSLCARNSTELVELSVELRDCSTQVSAPVAGQWKDSRRQKAPESLGTDEKQCLGAEEQQSLGAEEQQSLGTEAVQGLQEQQSLGAGAVQGLQEAGGRARSPVSSVWRPALAVAAYLYPSQKWGIVVVVAVTICQPQHFHATTNLPASGEMSQVTSQKARDGCASRRAPVGGASMM